MLAANAKLDPGAGGPAALCSDPDQVAHAVLVKTDKRILLEDALLEIGG